MIELKSMRPLVEYDDVSSDTLSDESEMSGSVVSSRVTPEKELKKPERHVSPATAIKAYKQFVDKNSPVVREKAVPFAGRHHHHDPVVEVKRSSHPPITYEEKYRSPSVHSVRETREPREPLPQPLPPAVPPRRKRSRTPEPPRAYRMVSNEHLQSSSPPPRSAKKRRSGSPREIRERRPPSPDRRYIRSPTSPPFPRAKPTFSLSRSRSPPPRKKKSR